MLNHEYTLSAFECHSPEDNAREAFDHEFNARWDDQYERYAGERIVEGDDDYPREFESCPLRLKLSFGFTLAEAVAELDEHNRFWGQLLVRTAVREREFAARWADCPF